MKKGWLNKLEVRELLVEKGHTVFEVDDLDLILHPNAVAWDDDMWKYLEVTLKAARKRRYPDKEKKKK